MAGTKAGQATTDEASIAPLSHVIVSDPDVGPTETATVTLSTAANGKLSNLGAGTLNTAGTFCWVVKPLPRASRTLPLRINLAVLRFLFVLDA